ncbi:MAG: putative secretion/fimbrial assembly protein [Acidobacteriaceae bacterium]|nr:putative secretion/fimbrial assembly protein [Acidobacteriaceae bacterium]
MAIFLVLLILGIAAPRVAQELRRDREVEAVHRANQYVRAIQVFYKKNGRYPTTMDQLEKTNNVRYLRQKYVDPTTGKADWRLIHVGEAKTTVKGFFGQPLSGLNTQNIGTGVGGATNVNSTGTTGATGSAGSSVGGSSTGGMGGTGFSLTGGVGGTPSVGGFGSASSTSTNSNGGVGSQSATDFKGAGGPIVGIGSAASGKSILELNEQTTYETWEFLYDPRIEQMKARASLFGGGATAANATTFGAPGSGISPATSTPSTTTPTPSGSTPTPP